MKIDAEGLNFKELNQAIRSSDEKDIDIYSLEGQRYILSGSKGKKAKLYGVPGNALGAFLDGTSIEVYDNAEDATGDTMNDGEIFIHGSVGDACGYAMRGGKIYVKCSAGYRAGIHMKAYKEKQPLIIIGETAGSFLGEYLAGGTIVVLNVKDNPLPPVGFLTGRGMHGGRIILRTKTLPPDLPQQIVATKAGEGEKKEISSLITEFCSLFNYDRDEIIKADFYILTPDSSRPYKRLYTNV